MHLTTICESLPPAEFPEGRPADRRGRDPPHRSRASGSRQLGSPPFRRAGSCEARGSVRRRKCWRWHRRYARPATGPAPDPTHRTHRPAPPAVHGHALRAAKNRSHRWERRQVRHHQVEACAVASVAPQPGLEPRIDPLNPPRHPVRRRIPARHVQSVRRKVNRRHCRPTKFARQRHRQASRPGSDVGKRKGFVPSIREDLQRRLDKQLRFRPRRQDRRPDGEPPAPELALSRDPRHRLAPFTPCNERCVPRREPERRRLPSLRKPGGPIPPQRVSCQQLGVGRRLSFRDAGADKARPGGSHLVDQGCAGRNRRGRSRRSERHDAAAFSTREEPSACSSALSFSDW